MHKMKYNKAIHNIIWQFLEFQEFGSFLASRCRTKIRDNHKGNIVGWHSRFLIACAHFWASLKWRVSASSWLSCCSLCHRVVNNWKAASHSCWTSGVPWGCLTPPPEETVSPFRTLCHSILYIASQYSQENCNSLRTDIIRLPLGTYSFIWTLIC